MFSKIYNVLTPTLKRPQIAKTEVLIWIAVFLSAFLKCMIFQFGSGLNSKPFLSSANLNMYISTLAILFIFIGSIYTICNQRRLTVLFVFQLLLAALLISDTVYFRYYYGIITIPVVTKSNLTRISGVNDSIQTLFQLRDILYVLDLPILFLAIRAAKKNQLVLPVIRKRVFHALVAIALCLVLTVSAVYRSEVDAFAYSENYTTKDLGVLYSHIDTTVAYTQRQFSEGDALTPEEIASLREFYDQARQRKKGPLTGIARDMNLIVVQAEAIQGFFN